MDVRLMKTAKRPSEPDSGPTFHRKVSGRGYTYEVTTRFLKRGSEILKSARGATHPVTLHARPGSHRELWSLPCTYVCGHAELDQGGNSGTCMPMTECSRCSIFQGAHSWAFPASRIDSIPLGSASLPYSGQ